MTAWICGSLLSVVNWCGAVSLAGVIAEVFMNNHLISVKPLPPPTVLLNMQAETYGRAEIVTNVLHVYYSLVCTQKSEQEKIMTLQC